MPRRFKLKKGSHTDGIRHYRSNDPKNNIIETDQNLAALEPARWEEWTGPMPEGWEASSYKAVHGQDQPDEGEGVAGNRAEGQADDSDARTPSQMRTKARWLRERAEKLEDRADELEPRSRTSSNQGQGVKEQPANQGTQSTGSPSSTSSQRTTGPATGEPNFAEMNAEQLKKHAQDNEIEVKANASKEDMLKAIKSHKPVRKP